MKPEHQDLMVANTDPMRERFWSLAMTLAYLVTNELENVRAMMNSYRIQNDLPIDADASELNLINGISDRKLALEFDNLRVMCLNGEIKSFDEIMDAIPDRIWQSAKFEYRSDLSAVAVLPAFGSKARQTVHFCRDSIMRATGASPTVAVQPGAALTAGKVPDQPTSTRSKLQRAKKAITELETKEDIESLTNTELIKKVGDLLGKNAPSPDTILRAAGRRQ